MNLNSQTILFPAELAVIIPTFNERDNVEAVVEALGRSLEGIAYEVIFVDDDSPDGTSTTARSIARTNPRVRVIQRIGRRGLSSASLEGMLSTSASYLAVMDADLQHDERMLPCMLARLKAENLDLVVATRNSEPGGMGELPKNRVQLSHFGRQLSRLVSKTDLSDPMSGFFLLDRRFLEEVAHSASGVGFKILVDLLSSAQRPVRFSEVPYTFRRRLHGTSKLDTVVSLEYLLLLLDKTVGDLIPPRFVIFSMVGGVGFLVFIGLLYVLFSIFNLKFVVAQAITTFAAMTANFFLNNSLTYRDRRLRGRQLAFGLLTFYAACLVGAVLNIRIAQFLKDANFPWYMAGVSGLAIGAVWNYGVTSIITWRRKRNHSISAQ
jgi:dolichol-phosphate mannosyltransferase